ncbi:MAG: universal stress protein [Nitrosopumilaceae archaeon]|nr:universal stress protein [Nitrosopumilaceae archaeon]NIU00906.1 universal stress protein [Nitrosopumilaceae archaeon]NIU87359.1 universal stress protein [Nitrosopumilaceae archaeon]NIV65887.1 universal stress protein [Nitrosopumilaceae archaeon]NIX61508.1 universal stress protein [Nitrosopumilaceae archaeon]
MEFQGIATKGDPSNKIIQYGEKNNFDLIIMGIKGKGDLSEMRRQYFI